LTECYSTDTTHFASLWGETARSDHAHDTPALRRSGRHDRRRAQSRLGRAAVVSA